MLKSKPKIAKILIVILSLLICLQKPLYTANRQPKELPTRLAVLEEDIIVETKQIEDLFYKRGKLYEDTAIIDYINKIEAKTISHISPDENINIEIKIIRDPAVNAFAMANGSIYIHTGALARLENEAQLSFLLAHESSHVIKKDMVYYVDSHHKKTIVYKLFDIVLAPTSVFFGILGDLTQMGFFLLHASTLTGYGRRIEARADKDGIAWATEAGYDPREAVGIMEIFLNEKEKYQKGQEIFFLMDHPTSKWRLEKLRKVITKEFGDERGDETKSEEFLKNMVKIKLYNATLNIKWDRLEHARDNIQWILEKFPQNAKAHYLAGEIYRLKAEDKNRLRDELSRKEWAKLNKGAKKDTLEEGWRNKAMDEYELAMECDCNYADPHKGLALLHRLKNDRENALEELEMYLEISPNACDKRYVKSLIKRLGKPEKAKK